MRPQTALALALFPFLINAVPTVPCKKDKDCSGENNICVLPEGSPGFCAPSCTLTSNARPCRFGQACKSLPQISTMQTGYCPEPPACSLIGVPCRVPPPARWCVDDPRNTCDPLRGGKKCPGICVVDRNLNAHSKTTLTTTTKKPTPTPTPTPTSLPPTDQSCGGFIGKACPDGYLCQDNPKDDCDPAHGGADCPGICVKARLCDSRGLEPCFADEECVHEPGCDAANDCPGVCTKKSSS